MDRSAELTGVKRIAYAIWHFISTGDILPISKRKSCGCSPVTHLDAVVDRCSIHPRPHPRIFDDVVFRWAFFVLAVAILVYVYRADIAAWLPELGP